MSRFAALLLLAGCDSLFGFDEIFDAPPPPPPDAAGACITDSFDGTTIGPQWGTFNDAATFLSITQDEQLILDLTGAANDAAEGELGARLTGSYDLRGGSVTVEVPQIVGGTMQNAENYLRVRMGSDSAASYVIRTATGGSPMIGFWFRFNGMPYDRFDRIYDPATDRFWRIVSQGDRVLFQVRGDATAEWQTARNELAPIPFDNVQVLLVAGVHLSGEAEPGMARFDNFALCPAPPP